MKSILIIFFYLFLFDVHAQFSNMKILSGKIEFKENLSYSESLKAAKKLTVVKGMRNIWIRKMGESRYGVSFMMSFDGTKESKHKALAEFRMLLGRNIKSWDLGTGLTWIKQTSLGSVK